MKLATWNVNSIRMRQERVLAWLEAEQPDVLCLQETKVIDDLFPVQAFEDRGYQVVLFGQKTYNGVAIVARQPISDVTRGFDDGVADDEARLVSATTAGVRVLSAYVPNGKAVGTDKYEYKLRWLERLRAHLDRTAEPTEPLVLCGDFNVAPDDRDVHDPVAWEGSVLCSEPERGALREVAAFGLGDAFRQIHQEGGLYSWWDYRQLGFPKNRGLRIDHIYATQTMMARLKAARIDREARKGKQPSDHAPVIAEFEPL